MGSGNRQAGNAGEIGTLTRRRWSSGSPHPIAVLNHGGHTEKSNELPFSVTSVVCKALHSRPSRVCVPLALVAVLGLTPAASPCQKSGGLFKDPDDGQFDVSEWLLTKKGFLAIPIIITEPAVGYGGGLALAFFNQSLGERAGESNGRLTPPLIAVAAGFYTDDGSHGGALGLFYPFRRDQFRYLGALGAASLNLDFYGFDPDGPLANNPVGYTLDPRFVVQRLQARLKRTDLFVGAHYLYLHTKSTFDVELPVDIPERDLKLTMSGLGASLEYDTRDNLLDARRGMDITASGTWYDDAFGSDLTFARYQVQGLFYWQPPGRWGYGLRVDSRFSSADAPFFMKPFLSMRGLASGQYSNDVTLLSEGELRFALDPRWTLLGFGGAGRVGETLGDLGSAPTVGAGGVGFRYLIARKLGLGSGVDFAFGPGWDFAFYIQTGSPWR